MGCFRRLAPAIQAAKSRADSLGEQLTGKRWNTRVPAREAQKHEAQKRIEAQKLQAREAQKRVLQQRAVATGNKKDGHERVSFEERFRVMEKDHMFTGGDHRLVHGGVLIVKEQCLGLRVMLA